MNALGNLTRVVLLAGQRHDTVGVGPLIRDLHFDALLADKAFDVNWLRAELNHRGARAVIPPKANRKQQIADDKDMYRWRHLVENYFANYRGHHQVGAIAVINIFLGWMFLGSVIALARASSAVRRDEKSGGDDEPPAQGDLWRDNE